MLHGNFFRHILLLALIALVPSTAAAQVIISEIMYDAPGTEGSGDHDWIEVFNAGPDTVDLSTYRFFESGTNHTLKIDQGAPTLAAGEYAVIANIPATFKIDWPSYAGILFDSSFNLNSTGELIGIRTGDLANTETPFTYTPQDATTNNGSSLQRNGTSSTIFSAAVPTPGTGSLVAQPSGSPNASAGNSSPASTTTQSASTASVSSYVAPPVPEVFADAGVDQTVIVGADVEFNARAYNRQQETLDHTRFLWNFGDGSIAEGPAVLHHFEYPGRYAVTLDIAQNKSAVSDKVIVTAEPAKLAFSTLSDGSVTIENRAGRDLDLSYWIVRQFGRDFTLPTHSLVLAGSAMHISQKTLGFWSGPSAELKYPNGVLALHAGESTGNAVISPGSSVTPPAPVSVTVSVQAQTSARVSQTALRPADPAAEQDVALTATAEGSGILAGQSPLDGALPLWGSVLALGALIVLGISAVLYARLPGASVLAEASGAPGYDETAALAKEFQIIDVTPGVEENTTPR